MSTTFTCGHTILEGEEHNLSVKTTIVDEDGESPAVIYGTFCQACANRLERDGFVLHTPDEINAYLYSEDQSEWKTY